MLSIIRFFKIKTRVKTEAKLKIRVKFEVEVKSRIRAKLILLASLSLESANLNCINLKKLEPNVELLRRFFLENIIFWLYKTFF